MSAAAESSLPSKVQWKVPPRGNTGDSLITFFGILVLVLLILTEAAVAKPPVLIALDPAGGRIGATVTVTAFGSFDHWPPSIWIDDPKIRVAAASEKGKLNVTVPAEARPGLYSLRFHDREGATAIRRFMVSALPEVNEIEPNDSITKAHRIDGTPVIVNGRLAKNGDVDCYTVPLKSGQHATFGVVASELIGSPMDAVLQVASIDGFVLAQNDDTVGRDPRIEFDAPSDGIYLVRVFAFPLKPDSSVRFAGGEAFVYRLQIATAGFLDYAFPLAIHGETPATVELIGSNIPSALRRIPLEPGKSESIFVSSASLPGQFTIVRTPLPTVIEAEPNEVKHPQHVPDIATVNGRIDPASDRDHYLISLKKGEKRRVSVYSRSLGLPLDPVLTIANNDKVLIEKDDQRENRDPTTLFTAPADGDYIVSVGDLHGFGGSRYAYRLDVAPVSPDFTLSVAKDRYEISEGKPLSLPVTVNRGEGDTSEITITADGLSTGLTSTTVISRPGDATAKSVSIELSAMPGASAGPFRVVGKLMNNASPPRVATAPVDDSRLTTADLWLTVSGPASPVKK